MSAPQPTNGTETPSRPLLSRTLSRTHPAPLDTSPITLTTNASNPLNNPQRRAAHPLIRQPGLPPWAGPLGEPSPTLLDPRAPTATLALSRRRLVGFRVSHTDATHAPDTAVPTASGFAPTSGVSLMTQNLCRRRAPSVPARGQQGNHKRRYRNPRGRVSTVSLWKSGVSEGESPRDNALSPWEMARERRARDEADAPHAARSHGGAPGEGGGGLPPKPNGGHSSRTKRVWNPCELPDGAA